MSGIILLVSIVVSINSIVVSKDIESVRSEAEQTRGTRNVRNEIGTMTEPGRSPSDPSAFLRLMATVIGTTTSGRGVAVDAGGFGTVATDPGRQHINHAAEWTHSDVEPGLWSLVVRARG